MKKNYELKMKTEYDSPWKEIIEQYFPEFIAFFFPDAYKDIDWTKRHEFLNKELRQITRDAEIGRKYVDKLVRVWLKNGDDAWAMIHADVQTQHEKNFAERMYVYNYRLFDRYRRHAASFAVIGDAGKKWCPETYKQELWGCNVSFEFPVVKLSEYAKDWNSLKADSNPFAIVVMAHLLTQKTAGDHDRRKNEKLTLIKELYRKGFSKQDIINLFRFIDWIMDLPETQEKLFWQEFTDMEEEKTMRYMTTGERIGFKRGVEQGVQQGIQQGFLQAFSQQTMIFAKQIAKKFRSRYEDELPKLRKLSSDDLMELGEKLFDFDSLTQVHEWIDKKITA